ncbi:unnamed protein product [Tilletia caries]|nr:unnamed protein product [Tilletia caries]
MDGNSHRVTSIIVHHGRSHRVIIAYSTSLFATVVLTLYGPQCSVYAPNPNATFAQRISDCYNGAQVHHISNDKNEVFIEQSCISWCSHPDYDAVNSSVSVYHKWQECVGVFDGVHCEPGYNVSQIGSSSAAFGGPVAAFGSPGGGKGVVVMATMFNLPWAMSAVVAA